MNLATKSSSVKKQPSIELHDNDDFFNTTDAKHSFSNLIPPVDIIESHVGYEIQLVAPGLEPADFTIEVNDGVLTICADREERDNSKSHLKVKKSVFVRSFILPSDADESHVKSFYEDGVLKVHINKLLSHSN